MLARTLLTAIIANFFLVGGAVAQQVLQATADFQPLTYTDESGYKGCGIRATVMYDARPVGAIQGVELSLNVWIRPQISALVKAGEFEVTSMNPAGIQRAKPEGLSLSAEQDGVPLSLGKLTPGENEGFVIAGADLKGTLKLLAAMLAGERVVVGSKRDNQHGERRYAFSGQMGPTDMGSMRSCLAKIVAASASTESTPTTL